MKTRERILQASLELFNTRGERNVTTNHIASHLGISPGNLYYHFRNKQMIVAELFTDLELQMAAFFATPTSAPLSLDDKADYLERLLEIMWQFRFLHQDLEHMLEVDSQLAERYRAFVQRCLQNARAIYQAFIDAGILIMDQRQMEALLLTAWIIISSWARLLCTGLGEQQQLTQPLMRRGIYQLLMLEDGYIAPAYREAIKDLYTRLHVPLTDVVPGLVPSADM